MPTISRLTREYVRSVIISPNDLSTATAEFAFMAPGAIPAEIDWNPGSIVSFVSEVEEGDWEARILVGDGADVTLVPPDTYPYDWQAWLRITDIPERPVRRPGIVTVE